MDNIIEFYSDSGVESKTLQIVKMHLGEYFPEYNFFFHLVYTTIGKSEKVVFLKTSTNCFKNVKPKLSLAEKLDKLSFNSFKPTHIESIAYCITTHGYENFNYESFIKPIPGFESITLFTHGYILWKHQMQVLIMQVLQCNEAEAKQWIKDYNKKVPAVREAMHMQFYHGQTLHEIIEKYNPSPGKFFLDAPLEQAEILRPKPFNWPNSNGNLPDRIQELLQEIDRLNKIIEINNNNNGNQE